MPEQTPLCTRCSMHRDANVHLEQYRQNGYHPYTDATKVVVTFTRQEVDDDAHADLSFLEQDYEDVADPAERAKYKAQDQARLDAYNRGEWHMMGIRAKAVINVYRPGYISLYELTSPGLWGIENDCGEAYCNEVFEDEKHVLRRDIEAIMSAPIEWK